MHCSRSEATPPLEVTDDAGLAVLLQQVSLGWRRDRCRSFFFFLNDTPPTEIYPLPLPAPLPIWATAANPDRIRRSEFGTRFLSLFPPMENRQLLLIAGTIAIVGLFASNAVNLLAEYARTR